MAIGVPRKEVYHSTLVQLRLYDKAFKIRREIEDERDYMCGIYTYEAFQVVLANAFSKKGAKPVKYRDMPIIAEIKAQEHENNLSEEEKAHRRKQLLANLVGMQERFEAAK